MAFAIVFWAVMMMKSVSTPASRARERTSSPERSGILMSTSATSNERSRSAASASPPEATLTTSWPPWVQARSSTQRIDSSSSATRMVPGVAGVTVGLSGGVWDMVLTDGESHAEARAAPGARFVGDGATVLDHDAVAHREAEPGAARLGGEEG